MYTALVCIAKNEDRYISEWISYNLGIGFDDIFVYANDWDFVSNNPRVHVIRFDGQARQLDAYNDFLTKYSPEYDWVLIADVDEFLNLNGKYRDVKEMFEDYDAFHAVCFNWLLFGDSGLGDDGTTDSVLKRFRKHASSLNQHVKTALHTAKCRNIQVRMVNPHFSNCQCYSNFAVSADKKSFVIGPWHKDDTPVEDYGYPVLCHFFCKTLGEYRARRSYGRADTKPDSGFFKRSDEEFYAHNFNESSMLALNPNSNIII